MISTVNKNNNVLFFVTVSGLILLGIFFQVFLIKNLPSFSLAILLIFNLIGILLLYYIIRINHLPTFLLIVYLVPLLYFNNNFHYSFLIQSITLLPLYFMILLAVSKYLSSTDSIRISFTYLSKPVIIFIFYFLIIALISLGMGQDKDWVFNQFFQLLQYAYMIPFLYLLNDRKHYRIIFGFLLVLFSLIAVQYLLLNLFLLKFRFITFQSSFLPVAIGVAFSLYLYGQNIIQKFKAISFVAILSLGTFATLTRSLWVTALLVIYIVMLYFLYREKHWSLKKLAVLSLFLASPFIFAGDLAGEDPPKLSHSDKVEYRAQSVANPLSDSSFLMRVEIAYTTFQRYLTSPVIGTGLGDYVKYRFLFVGKEKLYYIDNSWLYILWKGGIIGLFLFVWLYIRFFKAAYFVYKNTDNREVKYLTLGVLGGMLGLALMGFLNPHLIKYKLNIIFAFIFAYVDFEHGNLKKNDLTPHKEIQLENNTK